MLINTDLEEDDDYYEDEHDDFGEDLDKENEGIKNVDYVNIILVAKVKLYISYSYKLFLILLHPLILLLQMPKGKMRFQQMIWRFAILVTAMVNAVSM